MRHPREYSTACIIGCAAEAPKPHLWARVLIPSFTVFIPVFTAWPIVIIMHQIIHPYFPSQFVLERARHLRFVNARPHLMRKAYILPCLNTREIIQNLYSH